MGPLVDQGPHDKQAEDGRPFRQFLQEAAAHIGNDIDPFLIAVGDAVVTNQQTYQVKQHEEQDRAQQATGHCDTGTEGGEHRTDGTPEDRVTDASQRSHQTDLDTVDRGIVDRGAVSTFLFHRHGHAENRRRDERLGVKELQMAADCLAAFFAVLRIQATDHRHHGETETQRLHTFEVP